MTAPRRLIALLALLVALAFSSSAAAAGLTVYFFDVGQGDSILVVSPAGKTVLIDAGPPGAGEELAARLKQILSAPIDLLILTHPHADHLGGMERVLQAVGARLFMEPGYNHPSPLYARLLEALEEKQIPLKIGEAGRNVELGGGATLRLLAPKKPFLHGTRSDNNANCIVARLTFGKTAFYFGCDSEPQTESRILATDEELRSDVYKVAHHGSRYPSGKALLARMRPEVAIVSVGGNNDYGHPTRQTLDRLEDMGAKVYRTDLDGEIVVRSNGKDISVSTERGGDNTGLVIVETKSQERRAVEPPPKRTKSSRRNRAAQTVKQPQPPPSRAEPAEQVKPVASGYVASKNSTVFHKPGCYNAERIKPKNLVLYRTRDEAIAAGRRPAKDCNP